MKKTAFFLILIFNSFFLFSQEDNTSKLKANISIGASIPLGDFGNSETNNSNNNSGFALLGYNLNLKLKYGITRSIGFLASYTINSNGFNNIPLKDQINLAFPSLYVTISNNSNYKSSAFWGGFYLNSNLSSILKIETRALIGYSSSWSPELVMKLSDGLNIAEATILKDDAKSVSYSFGIGLNYFINNKFALLLNLDYYFTEPEFETITSSTIIPSETNKYNQKISILNTCLGFEYSF